MKKSGAWVMLIICCIGIGFITTEIIGNGNLNKVPAIKDVKQVANNDKDTQRPQINTFNDQQVHLLANGINDVPSHQKLLNLKERLTNESSNHEKDVEDLIVIEAIFLSYANNGNLNTMTSPTGSGWSFWESGTDKATAPSKIVDKSLSSVMQRMNDRSVQMDLQTAKSLLDSGTQGHHLDNLIACYKIVHDLFTWGIAFQTVYPHDLVTYDGVNVYFGASKTVEGIK